MLKWIRKKFGSKVGTASSVPSVRVAATQTPFETPRVRAKEKAYPAWMTSTNMPDSTIRVQDRNVASTDLSRLSKAQGTQGILRNLAHTSPDLSAALGAYLRTGITKEYFAVARNPDGTSNQEATALAWQLLNRFDFIPDFSKGFTGANSLRTTSESMAKELMLYGACALELVLDKSLLPVRLEPISVTNLRFKPKDKRLVPVQDVGGTEIDLDVPTFFYTALDRELMEAYPSSPMESAIKPTYFSEEFMADLQRVVRRSVYPRMEVVIDEESIRKYAPAQAQHDQEAMDTYLEQVIGEIEGAINNLNPEDAVIHQDSIKVEMLTNGNISLSREWETLENMTNAKTATGAKVLPAILGHNVGSSNIASTETLLFMKNVEGSVQLKLNEVYSRALTLAIRLFGLDCYVEFRYDDINLRPESELEAFKSLKQSRVLELLSLGVLTDEDASLELTGYLPPPTMPKLSGTMFRSATPTDLNPYLGENNNGSTMNQSLEPQTPTGARGQNNRRNNLKE